MTKKERTFVFNICVLLYNLVLGLVIEGFLFLAVIFLISKNQNLAESIFSQIALPLVLLAGLITAMAISVKTVGWFIKKFNLEDKLDEKLVSRYKKDN
ncbi:MAG: hypothetical protein IJJ71_12035 [Treponema sp.]|uniref:hypothetical protein n=1 Tax=Treponema sp. TaxID=166 RepID=UPI0025DF7A78|nr:hypothetical protein [Treponema sp.]MBQ9622233.1 hypothetical protein [Treponema sp.]MBR0496892.1 hypothetical protein [Treponema sp.]